MPSFSHFETGPTQPVLTGGPPGSWDEVVREKVVVMQEGSQYKMWYCGHPAGNQPSSKIGYATSPDGITWTKYAGNPIISRPSQDQDMSVVKVGPNSYYMYVEVNDQQIDLLTSSDGINWTPYANNPVKPVISASPVVWIEGNIWYLLYEDLNGPVFNINLATSSDGIHWVDSPANPVLREAQDTVPDSILKDGDTYHLYYHRQRGGWPAFHATSTNLTTWTNRELLFTSFSSQFTFRTSSGDILAYFHDFGGDEKYHLRYGLEPPAVDSLVRHFAFDETSGITAHDSSANHADATLLNGPVWTSGKIGGGLQFDGINDYVDTGFHTDIPHWTISAWVRSPVAPAANPASGPVLREKNYQINWDHPDPRFRGAAALNVAGEWYVASFGPLVSDTWYFLTATYDGGSLRAYRDGALITESAVFFPEDPSTEVAVMTIGKSAVADQYFLGTIDEVRLHSRALNDFEIATLYQSNALPPSSPIGVVAAPVGETINLTWLPAADFEKGVSSYRIYRGTTSANKVLLAEVSSSPPLTYVDAGTLPQTTYYYQVSAVNNLALEGQRSSTVSATTGNIPPAAPTGLTASYANNNASLDWADNHESDLAGYFVYKATTAVGPFVKLNALPVTTSAFTATGLTNGVIYYFRVTAVDNAGNESLPTGVVPSGALFASINDVSVIEGNSGTKNVTLTVTLSGPAVIPIAVNYSLVNGTAALGSDYTGSGGTLSFGVGVSTMQITASIIGDCALEPDETFIVRLTGATGAIITKSDGVVTIVNDDNRSLSIAGVTVTEGDSGTTGATFNVTLSPAACGTVIVNYATANGTALAGSDYLSTSGTLTFAPGETTKPITVQIVGDTVSETTKSFFVNLSSPVNATIATAQGVGTILDNDPQFVAFRDDFNDNTRDAAKWVTGSMFHAPSVIDSLVTVLEQNGRLEITPRSNVSSLHFNGYLSTASWNMTNGQAQVEVLQTTNGPTAMMSFIVGRDLLSWYAFSISGGQLYFQEVTNGNLTSGSLTSISFSPTQHGFLRLRHDPASGRVVFETSGDGATWTVRRTVATTFSLSSLRVTLIAGTLASTGAPGKAIFDNFQLQSNAVPVTGQPPVSVAGGPYGGSVGQAVAFTSAGSSDPDGTITSYQWTFGDGTNGTGAAPSHVYSSAGNYIVTLTVTDNSGNARRASTLVVISSSPPTAPSNLTAASPSAGAVRLTWQDRSSNELQFRIERSTSATTGFTEVGTVGIDSTAYTEQGLLRGKIYYYRVRASNNGGNSAYSNTVSVKTL